MDALEGLRVIDMATVLAGPEAARYLADFGAEVIKVERPEGDGIRRMGVAHPDGDSYLWKLVGRGKRAVTLDLKSAGGLGAMLELCDTADVLIENLRPGALERLGLDPAELLARNPRLVVLRVTGFGQTGPYAHRPGFATTAEAMSGFAALNGEPDGAPLLPPIALTDEIAGLAGAFAVLVALRHRDRTGEGQVIDVNLLEAMLQFMGQLPSAWAHTGYLQPRLGAGIPYSVPRGTYRCGDGKWVAISTSSESVARRVMELLGLGDDPRFETFDGRIEHRHEVDAAVAAWIGARTEAEVLEGFERAEAAAAPVYTMADLFADPHVQARDVIVEVGSVRMQGPIARLARTPARLRHPGRALGADTDAVLAQLASERERASQEERTTAERVSRPAGSDDQQATPRGAKE